MRSHYTQCQCFANSVEHEGFCVLFPMRTGLSRGGVSPAYRYEAKLEDEGLGADVVASKVSERRGELLAELERVGSGTAAGGTDGEASRDATLERWRSRREARAGSGLLAEDDDGTWKPKRGGKEDRDRGQDGRELGRDRSRSRSKDGDKKDRRDREKEREVDRDRSSDDKGRERDKRARSRSRDRDYSRRKSRSRSPDRSKRDRSKSPDRRRRSKSPKKGRR